MHSKIKQHFKKHDPKLHKIIEEKKFSRELTPKDPSLFFEHMVSNIVGQQLSNKVADVIWNRFVSKLPKQKVDPKYIYNMDIEEMRSVGMSYSKAQYIKNIAEKYLSKEIVPEELITLPDEEVINKLVQIKGVGKWTAEMFLMFTLARENVFSLGDGGLRRAFVNIYGFDFVEKKDKAQKIIEKWAPYKTYAALVLWYSLDNE